VRLEHNIKVNYVRVFPRKAADFNDKNRKTQDKKRKVYGGCWVVTVEDDVESGNGHHVQALDVLSGQPQVFLAVVTQDESHFLRVFPQKVVDFNKNNRTTQDNKETVYGGCWVATVEDNVEAGNGHHVHACQHGPRA